MTPKQRVLRRFPKAVCEWSEHMDDWRAWHVFRTAPLPSHPFAAIYDTDQLKLSHGRSPQAAWRNAANFLRASARR